MTEYSYFYNGTGAGHAQYAPYDAYLYAKLRGIVHGSRDAFVWGPDAYAASTDPLSVVPNAGMVVSVRAGRAYMCGFTTYNSATTKTIPSNTSGMPRIDRIVMQLVWGTTRATTQIVIKTGVPNTIPNIPALVQDIGSLYEMPLARIYVPDGLAAVSAGYIIDERRCLDRTTEYYSNQNLMPNSEFMAKAGTSGVNGSANGYAPAFWQLAAATTSITPDVKFDQMERGSTCRVTCSALNDGMQMTLPNLANGTNSYKVTIKLLIEVIKGEVWIDTAGGGASGVRVPITAEPVEVILRQTFSPADQALELWIYNILSTETIFRLGQVTVAHGWTGAPYKRTREVIIFNKSCSSGVTLRHNTTRNAVISNQLVCPGVTSLLAKLVVSDAASNGTANLHTEITDPYDGADHLRVEYGNNPNSTPTVDQGFVGMVYNVTAGVWQTQVTSLGTSVANYAGTLYVLGCIT